MSPYTLPARLLVVAFALFAIHSTAIAQEEMDRDWLVVEKIDTKVVKKSGDAEIKITGKTKNIPAGTEVVFRLTLHSREIARWTESLRPGKFESKYVWKNPTIAREMFFLWTEIPLEDQKSSIKKALEKSDKFDTDLEPWAIQHVDNRFRIEDKAALAKLEAQLAQFFHGNLTELRGIEKASREKIAAYAKPAGEEGAEEFDAKEWRKFQDSKIIKPLRTIQKTLADADEAGTYRAQVAQLYSLREISRAISAAVLDRSKNLYKERGLPWDEMDTEKDEHGLDTDHRARSLKNDAQLVDYLKGHAKRISQAIPKPKASTGGSKGKTDKKKGGEPGGNKS